VQSINGGYFNTYLVNIFSECTPCLRRLDADPFVNFKISSVFYIQNYVIVKDFFGKICYIRFVTKCMELNLKSKRWGDKKIAMKEMVNKPFDTGERLTHLLPEILQSGA
jgi:hypothetical protein